MTTTTTPPGPVAPAPTTTTTAPVAPTASPEGIVRTSEQNRRISRYDGAVAGKW